jgi:protein TonB
MRTTWEDLVFEHRNKLYGAYNLRQVYGRTVVIAFAVAVAVLALVMAFPAIKIYFSEKEVIMKTATTIKYTDLLPPPPIDANKPPPPKIEVPPIRQAIKFLPPKVTTKEVIQQEELPTIEQLRQNEISTEALEGVTEVTFPEVVEDATKEVGDDPYKVWAVVEQPPEFPGGMAALMKFISRNMRYPTQARRIGTEGSVFVSFVVAQDGTITEVEAIKGIASDCDKEAMRVIQSMPPWKPGKQNGKPVRVRFVLPIRFILGNS